jgi:LmbE family N-acetylglucosaminyl deacetylase
LIRSRTLIALAAAALALVAPRSAHGQERGAAALDQLVRGLTTTGRVLVIGAHPDDEDTQLLAWLARGHQVQVAYLSMTRGDGGQNLIGDELGEALGAIRTEELLAARRLDGAQQFFSRAYDFGFSKNAEETFLHWDRAQLTADVVRVIRAYRPHVVIAVWSGTRNDGHGHHEAAGLLAREGFELAGDTVRFPVAAHGRPWVPAKLYRGAWARALQPTLTFNVGAYDAVMGRSPAELAAASRSQHRSQGQGGLERRGAIPSRLTRELSRVNEATPATEERSIFDGVDTSIAHVAALDTAASAFVRRAAAQADWVQRTLDLRRPHLVVDTLAQMVVQLEAARNEAKRCGVMPPRSIRMEQVVPVQCSADALDLDVTLDRLLARAQRALLEAAGVAIEVTAEKELLAFADSMQATVTVHNRGRAPIAFRSLRMTGSPPFSPTYVEIAPDSSFTLRRRVLGFVDHRPWWLGGRTGAMFADTRSPADGAALVSYGADAALLPSVALAEDVRRISDVQVTLGVGSGVTTTVSAGEVMHRVADPVMGEQWRPAGGVPPVTLELDRGFEWMRADQPLDRRIRLTMRSHTVRARRLALKYLLPQGLRVEGVPDTITLAPGEVREIPVRLRGQLKPGRHEFGIGAESEGTTYTEGFRAIEYPHIRPIRLYRSSALYLQAVAVNVPRTLMVAYVAGVSDAVAPALQGLDIPLVMLTPDELALMDLARFSTVVIGPRAYETHAELETQNPRLLEWVRNGGTLVVQYGQFEMARPGMMPYPVAFTRPAARVTLEGAPVRTLEPASKLLTWPNRITETDWSEWVQERGLYMPTTIDSRYRTPLAMNDPGEPENRGAILETTLGKGRYVYTSLSLFRQIPAGVPGSMRLLVNLLSAGIITTQP